MLFLVAFADFCRLCTPTQTSQAQGDSHTTAIGNGRAEWQDQWKKQIQIKEETTNGSE